MAPQSVLLNGEDVMGQVPVVQPINLQYRNPPNAPMAIPKSVSQCLLNCSFIIAICSCIINWIFSEILPLHKFYCKHIGYFPIKQVSNGKYVLG